MASKINLATSGGKRLNHQGASRWLSDLRSWNASQVSADAAMTNERRPLTDRARDLERNSGLARGAPQLFVDHVVGPDLRLNSRPNWRALNQDQEWAMEWSTDYESRFHDHVQQRMAFDVEGQANFTEFGAQIVRGDFSAGGHIVLPFWKPTRPGVRYGTCFLSVEIDRLKNPVGKVNNRTLRDGIQLDDSGVFPVGYHIRRYHPGDWLHFGHLTNESEYIEARFPWGRPRVLHCFMKERGGQTRGGPALASVLREFKAMSRYRQAELNAAVSHALATFFVKTTLSPEQVAQLFDSGEHFIDERLDHNTGAGGAREQLALATQEDNYLVSLFPGDEVELPKSVRANDQFGPFNKFLGRNIGAALGISGEAFMRDFSEMNYSNARVAILNDWRRFGGIRTSLIANSYGHPVNALMMEEMVEAGDIEAPGFYENLQAYTRATIVGAGRGWVDPAREAAAAGLRMQNGISNLQIEAAEQGYDWQDVMMQRALEIKTARDMAARLGLPEEVGYILAGLQSPNNPLFSTPLNPNFLQPPAGEQ